MSENGDGKSSRADRWLPHALEHTNKEKKGKYIPCLNGLTMKRFPVKIQAVSVTAQQSGGAVTGNEGKMLLNNAMSATSRIRIRRTRQSIVRIARKNIPIRQNLSCGIGAMSANGRLPSSADSVANTLSIK